MGQREKAARRLARTRVQSNTDEIESLTERVAELEAEVTALQSAVAALQGSAQIAYPGEYGITGMDADLRWEE